MGNGIIPASILALIQTAEDDLATAQGADHDHQSTLDSLTLAQHGEAMAMQAALDAHQIANASAQTALDALKAQLGIA